MALLFGLLAGVVFPIPEEQLPMSIPMGRMLFSEEGELLDASLAKDGQWRFPLQDSLPEKFKVALLTAEDQYFPYHLGFNPVSMLRATWVNLKAGSVKQGGSTLTQQTVRVIKNNPPRGIWEKLVELRQAINYELWFSKEEILRRYITLAPMGGNIVGLPAACWRYFGEIPSEISWAQAATLAVLPNAPGLVTTEKNQVVLLNKRNKLLHKLHQLNKIDGSTLARALEEPLIGPIQQFPRLAGHYLQHLSKTFPQKEVLETTLSAPLQARMAELLKREHFSLSNRDMNNIGLIAIRLSDQAVIAYHGNFPHTTNHWVDMVQAKRSYGSLLKPFLLATAMADGKILPQAWLEDVPTLYEGSYAPKNFNNQYSGLIPADIALARSLNIPYVNLQREVGTARFLQVLKAIGLKSLNKTARYYGLSLVLGGGESSLFQLAGAYALLANSAQQSPNYASTLWKANPSLRLLKDSIAHSDVAKIKLWNQEVACHVVKALQLQDRPDMDLQLKNMIQNQKISWKTGTSWGLRDAWCIGFDTEYLVGVWVGNADGHGVNGLTGIRIAAPLMFRMMELMPQTTGSFKDFTIPPAAQQKTIKVCSRTGYPAGENCIGITYQTVSAEINYQSTCKYHKRVLTNLNKSCSFPEGCNAQEELVANSYLILPPAAGYYLQQSQRNSYSSEFPPPVAPTCFNGNSTQLLYPRPNAILVRDQGEIIAKAYQPLEDGPLLWLLDGEALGQTEGPTHRMPLTNLSVGDHTLSIVGAQSTQIKFTIKN